MRNTSEIGHKAEQWVARRLKRAGLKIRARNYRTQDFEIDIVAESKDAIFIVEVKYRSSSWSGQGYETVDQKKLRKMRAGAWYWLGEHPSDKQLVLTVASVDSQGMIEFFDVD